MNRKDIKIEQAKTISAYRLEEMKTLRAEIVSSLNELHRIENFVVASCGAIYAFYFSNMKEQENIATLLFASPIAITSYGYFRSSLLSSMIELKDCYIRNIESNISTAGDCLVYSRLIRITDYRNDWRKEPRSILSNTEIREERVEGWVQFYYANRSNSYVQRKLIWRLFTTLTVFMFVIFRFSEIKEFFLLLVR